MGSLVLDGWESETCQRGGQLLERGHIGRWPQLPHLYLRCVPLPRTLGPVSACPELP